MDHVNTTTSTNGKCVAMNFESDFERNVALLTYYKISISCTVIYLLVWSPCNPACPIVSNAISSFTQHIKVASWDKGERC